MKRFTRAGAGVIFWRGAKEVVRTGATVRRETKVEETKAILAKLGIPFKDERGAELMKSECLDRGL